MIFGSFHKKEYKGRYSGVMDIYTLIGHLKEKSWCCGRMLFTKLPYSWRIMHLIQTNISYNCWRRKKPQRKTIAVAVFLSNISNYSLAMFFLHTKLYKCLRRVIIA